MTKEQIERVIDHTGKKEVATEWKYHKVPLIYRRLAT